MPTPLVAFLATTLPMLAIDAVWLIVMHKRFYAPRIGHLMAPNPDFMPVIAFYLLYGIGLTVLVVLPALRGGWNTGHTFLMGTLLGLVAYGTYDLTNQATLLNWPVSVTIIDLAWGSLLTGTVAVIATLITHRFTT
jgi:uncharacterized membrane protein